MTVIQMSILINFKVIFHSWPKLQRANIVTADNYIIFNNLIIGQTANDHSAEVNMLGRRIELQFILMRLTMQRAFMCTLHEDMGGSEKPEKEVATVSRCRQKRRKPWTVTSCVFCPPSTQEVNQCHGFSCPFGVSASLNTRQQEASHAISTAPTMLINFPPYPSPVTEPKHCKPTNHYTENTTRDTTWQTQMGKTNPTIALTGKKRWHERTTVSSSGVITQM